MYPAVDGAQCGTLRSGVVRMPDGAVMLPEPEGLLNERDISIWLVCSSVCSRSHGQPMLSELTLFEELSFGVEMILRRHCICVDDNVHRL
ncbi:hypothetical protein CONPUDRAFT_84480 [Coniophora puteana RWD-64-598 SS2]|uniref:Uncharacterized protein n=1 Tax=Coniophora puteana (strain RWD-64-598) TaxID=741705 RepID=A0A5M3MFI0_CONPW|nr:uncharacterized protein CONPUDRAFT_84480 [Coniophora puteana RWD-64-598 SS2]EIW77375.1 hypothetical protein CONPUDRAFT_84480 [Coniophora puteana RWD-64-598 SS2]